MCNTLRGTMQCWRRTPQQKYLVCFPGWHVQGQLPRYGLPSGTKEVSKADFLALSQILSSRGIALAVHNDKVPILYCYVGEFQ